MYIHNCREKSRRSKVEASSQSCGNNEKGSGEEKIYKQRSNRKESWEKQGKC